MTSENFRLKDIRKKLGITQKEFSKSVGIKQGSYSDIERGKVGISANLMRNLVIKYRISPIWLYDGVGERFLNDEITKSIQGVAEGKSKYSIKESSDECDKCEQLKLIIQAHEKTIETQNDYIRSLKNIIAQDDIGE